MNTKFMQVHEDRIKLPNGEIIDDYSLVTLPDGVVAVATDENGDMILFREYKYAVNKTVLTFPAGGLDGDESPTDAAVRELLEETGYQAGEVEYLAPVTPYPSKVEHTSHVVRIKNAKKVTEVTHEATETISEIELVSPEQIPQLIAERQLNTTYMLAAVALAFPTYLTR